MVDSENEITITGDKSLSRRDFSRITSPLKIFGAILKSKENPEVAKKQLSLKYLHIKHAKTGILDAFCDLYIRYYKKTKNADFIYWTRYIYEPKELEASFSENKFLEKIVTKILRRE